MPCTRSKIEEAGWSLLLFKDFITRHGDTLLQFLLESKVPVAPHFEFTNKYSDLALAFAINQKKSPSANYLWRVETDLGDGGAHHFIIYVGNLDRTLTILDPAIGTADKSPSLYDIPSELKQLERLAKENGLTYKIAGPPSACQPHVKGISYEDTFCQTWSLLLGLAYVDDPEIYKKYKFDTTETPQLKLRLNNLFDGIQTILGIIVKILPKPETPYSVFDSHNSTAMVTYNQPKEVRDYYTDAKVYESLQFLISNPDCQYIAVRSTPFKSKKGGLKSVKKVTKKSSRLGKKTSRKGSKLRKKVTKKSTKTKKSGKKN